MIAVFITEMVILFKHVIIIIIIIIISMVFTPSSRAISMRVISQLLYNNYSHNYNKILTSDWPSAVLISAPVNLQNRTGEERRQHTLWDKRYNNFVLQNFSPNFTLF